MRDHYGVSEDVEVKMEKEMLRLFGHIERIDDSRLTK